MYRTLLRGILFLAALFLVFGDQQTCFAQFRGGRNIQRQTSNYLYNRPTVSPYLQLTTRSANTGLPNYFTMVRPQLERQQEQVAERRRSAQMQEQLNQVQNQVRQTQEEQAGMVLTGRMGWSARGMPRFGSYLNFYPGMFRIPRRQ